MRLAEKTIELTFCSQYPGTNEGPFFWFGLTQKQEAQAGFDAAVRLGGRLHIFQFKASAHDVGGARRFHAPHSQLTNLVARATSQRSVFYVLPEVGTTAELAGSADILGRSWLLDAEDLRDVEPPVTPWSTPRKNETHYFDLVVPWVTVHAPLYKRKVSRASDLARLVGEGTGLSTRALAEEGFHGFWSRPRKFTGTAAALVVS